MDQTKRDVEACFAHARDLLRAAKRVLEAEQLPSVSFHLAILALEEIGKASLLGARSIAREIGGETIFVDNRLDDHVFKLFWALWTPSFARGKDVKKDEFENVRGFAKRLHEDRLAAMYVTPDRHAGEHPLLDVSQTQARGLLKLAEARLGMETSRDWQAIDLSADSIFRWFLDATNDPEKRNQIFSSKSLDKLAELGRMPDWMVWLKQQFDQAEREGRENLQRELARAIPDENERDEPKWQVTIRLFSPSQSIRNRAIRSWNQRPTWIRLSAVNNDKHAVDVEFTYHEVVRLQALGSMSYHAARMFVAGMNVGSMGFWWWQRAEQTTRFYRRLIDLASPNMRPVLEMQVGPKFEWDRQALDEADLRRVAQCFGMITRLEQPTYDAVIGPYLSGIALIAKSDLHLNFAPQASERLAACLLEAMRCFGDWDGSDEGLDSPFSDFFRPLFKRSEDEPELLDLLRRLRRRPPDVTGITLERAAILKVLCDAYLIKQFETMAMKREGKEPPSSRAEQNGTKGQARPVPEGDS